jgi:hypothetical protein
MCEHCGAPITPYAHTDPVMGVLSRGFAAHKAVNEPKKLIVVIGMWLWILPMFFIGAWFVVLGIGVFIEGLTRRSGWGVVALPLAVLGFVFMWMAPTILYRTTRSYLRDGQERRTSERPNGGSTADDSDEAVECLECGESFPAGAESCPSCGWSYS